MGLSAMAVMVPAPAAMADFLFAGNGTQDLKTPDLATSQVFYTTIFFHSPGITSNVAGFLLNLTYDKAGNLLDEETVSGTSNTLLYTHDAWNRLVEVKFDDGTVVPRAQYAYSGLNWRTIKRADTTTPFDGILDEQRIMYYSSDWQLLEERIDDDLASGTIDRHVQYVWGPRYIDDIVLHRQDEDVDGYEDTWYTT